MWFSEDVQLLLEALSYRSNLMEFLMDSQCFKEIVHNVDSINLTYVKDMTNALSFESGNFHTDIDHPVLHYLQRKAVVDMEWLAQSNDLNRIHQLYSDFFIRCFSHIQSDAWKHEKSPSMLNRYWYLYSYSWV